MRQGRPLNLNSECAVINADSRLETRALAAELISRARISHPQRITISNAICALSQFLCEFWMA